MVMTKPFALSAPATDSQLELADVYQAHAGDVMRWATRLLGRPDDATDLAHEVFCVVQRRLPSFSAREGSLTTWLFRITANLVRSRRRRQRLRALFFAEAAPEVQAAVASEARDPEELATAREDVRLVYRVLDRLSEVDRSMLLLFELEGYSGAAVAELLDLPASTIWVRLHRARQRFLSKLNELEPRS
jgi:RNA polymerase sigma-70 factor, ECF subfamily